MCACRRPSSQSLATNEPPKRRAAAKLKQRKLEERQKFQNSPSDARSPDGLRVKPSVFYDSAVQSSGLLPKEDTAAQDDGTEQQGNGTLAERVQQKAESDPEDLEDLLSALLKVEASDDSSSPGSDQLRPGPEAQPVSNGHMTNGETAEENGLDSNGQFPDGETADESRPYSNGQSANGEAENESGSFQQTRSAFTLPFVQSALLTELLSHWDYR